MSFDRIAPRKCATCYILTDSLQVAQNGPQETMRFISSCGLFWSRQAGRVDVSAMEVTMHDPDTWLAALTLLVTIYMALKA